MKKPNIIWFMVDQMRAQAIGCNGDPNVFTPNLDNMSIAGTNFNRAVSGYPLCCPFRASMLTSKYAHNHSVQVHENRLDPSYKTVTDVFNQNGYETIHLGKWHLAGIKEANERSVMQTVPMEDRGRFDTWLGYDNNNSQWDTWLHGHENGEEVKHERLPGYETDCLMDMALERIEARKDSDRPFFMVISVQPPHWPNIAPPAHRKYQAQKLDLRPNTPSYMEQKARTSLAGYYGQIDNIDWNMGRLTQSLQDSSLLDDTQIMFFADHGDQMGSQGLFGKCVPYEESSRIPFFIGGGIPMSYDGRRNGNTNCPINHVDIAPTSLGLCGITTPDWMEGHDYSHHRTGKDFANRSKQDPKSAFLQLIGDRESSYAWRCVVTRDGWKYACIENSEWLMFNLSEDPYEQYNLAYNMRYRAKRDELKTLLKEWIDKTGDTFPLPNN